MLVLAFLPMFLGTMAWKSTVWTGECYFVTGFRFEAYGTWRQELDLSCFCAEGWDGR